MKHIKLRGTLVQTPTGYRVKVTILEQTHIGIGFAPSRVFRHNEFELRSGAHPEYRGVAPHLYLRGDNKRRDHHPVIVPLDIWKQIKEAVKAYNEAYKE